MKLKVGIFLGLGLAVFIGFLGFSLWAKGPSSGSIKTQTKGVLGAASNDTATELVAYDQLTLQIPRRFVSKNRTKGEGKPLYVQQLFTVPITDSQSIFGDQLAITIGEISTGGLNNVSDVQLRLRSGDYLTLQDTPERVMFEKTIGRYEVSIFVASSNKYASFVITGSPEKSVALKSEINLVAASVNWQ